MPMSGAVQYAKLSDLSHREYTPVPSLIEMLLAHAADDIEMSGRIDHLTRPDSQVSVSELIEVLGRLGLEADRVLISLQADVSLKAPSIGGRIRQLRQKANISQETLAKKIGVPTGTVTQWETGRRTPTFKLVSKLAKALGTDLNAFADCDLDEDEHVS